MPIIRSAKKALRQNVRRRKRNIKSKEVAKRALKSYKKLAAANDPRAAGELAKACKILDKMAKTGLIKKNKAARLKSRLAHLIAKATRASS